MNRELEALAGRYVKLARGDKRPLGPSWQTRATASLDEVDSWLADGHNVGLLLGPESGVVDIEFDSPAGREQLADMGLLDADTPTWQSARGEHRLFLWEPWMPECGSRKLGCIEARIGFLAAQSVLPPSRHPSGAAYEWIRRPSETNVASLPRWFFDDPPQE